VALLSDLFRGDALRGAAGIMPLTVDFGAR